MLPLCASCNVALRRDICLQNYIIWEDERDLLSFAFRQQLINGTPLWSGRVMSSIDLATRFKIEMYLLNRKSVTNAFSEINRYNTSLK